MTKTEKTTCNCGCSSACTGGAECKCGPNCNCGPECGCGCRKKKD